MTILLILLAVVVGLASVGAWRTIATFAFFVYSTILLGLGFILGGLLSFICFPAWVRTWHISDSWASNIADNVHSSIPALMSIPFVFVADVYRWMFEITVFQGTPFLWVTMIIAVWKVVVDARRAYRSFMTNRNEMLDLRRKVHAGNNRFADSGPSSVASTTLNPGYDAAGNFVGFKTVEDARRHGYY